MGNLLLFPVVRHAGAPARTAPQLCLLKLLVVTAFVLAAPLLAQQPRASANGNVEVRLELSWFKGSSHLREATVILQPLTTKGEPQRIRVVESITSVATLPPGRYQLTTVEPLVNNRQPYGWSIELPLLAAVNTVRLSPENAVRLHAGDFVQPEVVPGKRPSITPVSSGLNADARQMITALLDRWAASLRSRNLNSLMACYAPTLATDNGRTNVSREQVQAAKRDLLRTYDHVERFDLSNIELSPEGTTLHATAVKSWSFSNADVVSRGRSRVYFEFVQVNSRWAIASESDQPLPSRVTATQSASVTDSSQ